MYVHAQIHGSRHTWWDYNGEGNLASLNFFNNPVEFNSIDAIISHKLKSNINNISVLDIGFSTDIFFGGLAETDLEVIGIDLTRAALGAGRTSTKRETISIKHLIGCGGELPLETGGFDFACCGDVMEHTNILEEISRVLKKDGVFFYDTINRTSISNLIITKILKERKGTSIADPNVHKPDRLIGPRDLLKILDEHYLVHPGNDVSSKINFCFYYSNLRKRESGKKPGRCKQRPYLKPFTPDTNPPRLAMP